MAPSKLELPSGYNANQYWNPDLQSVPEPARTLFEQYSGIPDEKIADHVNEVVSPIACIAIYQEDANVSQRRRAFSVVCE